MIVGFGTYREGLELLIRALERADEQLLSRIIRYGRALEGGERNQLTYLKTFLESLDGRSERYFAAARRMRESIVFTGRLEHGVLARLHAGGRERSDAEHVPRGVRNGCRRGGRLRRTSDLAPLTRASPR